MLDWFGLLYVGKMKRKEKVPVKRKRKVLVMPPAGIDPASS